MKKGALIVIGIILSLLASAAEKDTTKITLKGKHILIIDGSDSTEIVLGDSLLSSRKRKTRDSHWAGFDLGVNGFLTPSGSTSLDAADDFLDLNYAKSVVVNLNIFEKYIPIAGDRFGLLTGLGFQWNNYDLDNDKRLGVTESVGDMKSQVFGYRDSSMASVSKNKFKATYLTLPILFEYNDKKVARKGFHISAGMLFGYRIGSKNKMKYTTEGGNDKKDKYRDDFNLNPFTYALTTRVGIGWFNMFATYNLSPLFQKDRGPELYPFTVGLTLLDF
jgi:hypothetical protein